jgi:hypothetical protein
MRGVKADESGRLCLVIEQSGPPVARKDSFDKILAKTHIMQSAFLFDRQHWQAAHQLLRKDAPTGPRRHTLFAVHPHPKQPTARGVLLEHIAVEPQGGQFLQTFPRPVLHRLGVVAPRFRGNQSWGIWPAGQAQTLARRAETNLDFGTHGNPFDITAKRFY